jgi:hypothetical protein
MNRAVQAANHADKDVINGWLETWTDTHTHTHRDALESVENGSGIIPTPPAAIVLDRGELLDLNSTTVGYSDPVCPH